MIFLLILLYFGLSIGSLEGLQMLLFLLAKDAFLATTPHYAFILASRENPQVGRTCVRTEEAFAALFLCPR